YLGGTGFGDEGRGIAVDSSGNAYITGCTPSSDFPTTSGAFQTTCKLGSTGICGTGFVTKLNAAGSALVYSTYLGGNTAAPGGGEVSLAIAVDASGSAYVTGATSSTDFPTANPFQAACAVGAF